MFKAISAVFAAALVAALFVILTAVAPQVKAGTPQGEPGAQQPSATDDSLPVRAIGTACSSRAWPYYTRDCLLEPSAAARNIRLITLDRVDVQPLLATSGVVALR